jgi:Cu/Ag efflux pump CusA
MRVYSVTLKQGEPPVTCSNAAVAAGFLVKAKEGDLVRIRIESMSLEDYLALEELEEEE